MSESSTARTDNDMTVHGLHVVIDGDPAAPPLLLIHGSGATGSTWEPVVPALATEYRVITIDLPGCGRSEPVSTYAVPRQAERVATVLDELGARNLTVVGHSSGGYVATALVEHRPDLVGELVLVSTGPSNAALLPDPLDPPPRTGSSRTPRPEETSGLAQPGGGEQRPEIRR